VPVVTERHVRRFYVFALVWGLGGLLDSGDRLLLDAHLRVNATALDLPPAVPDGATVFDFVVEAGGGGEWRHWNALLPPYHYPENSTPDYSAILVPIVDNVRVDYLVNLIAKQGKVEIIQIFNQTFKFKNISRL
jgi:dynein heavy chain, axonemal